MDSEDSNVEFQRRLILYVVVNSTSEVVDSTSGGSVSRRRLGERVTEDLKAN